MREGQSAAESAGGGGCGAQQRRFAQGEYRRMFTHEPCQQGRADVPDVEQEVRLGHESVCRGGERGTGAARLGRVQLQEPRIEKARGPVERLSELHQSQDVPRERLERQPGGGTAEFLDA